MPGRPSAPKLPSPSRIAERIVAVSGDEQLSPSHHPYAYNMKFGYSVSGVGCENAQVSLGWNSPSGMQSVYGQIGQYDSATNKWRFAPEYVTAQEAHRLAPYYQNVLAPLCRKVACLAEGSLVVDGFHQNTRRVRSQIARQMLQFDAHQLLQRDAARACMVYNGNGPPDTIEADDYTVVYAALGARMHITRTHEEVGIGDTITHETTGDSGERALVVLAKGVRINHPLHPGRTARHAVAIPVAHSSPDRSEWAPDNEVITAQEWEMLRPLPGILQLAEVTYPNFSGYHAAVAYNTPLGNTSAPMQ